ncbi:hypothetical protein CBR_g51482 [Chara braunii]|uniref:RING-type domain-containing protein n=1 Tax=Chara braunii TaxID=69332 RepID=A0A388K6C2_CHABU|nr:hypothetical protein CBR_g51482 [Chara braunii]|eukprot:GBG65600.1 hypothetical protein CBR_g51482 [Chara braunii]
MKAGDPAKSERREMLICLSDLRKETECPICLGIIRKTRTVMECLHRFCRECIDKAMRIGNNECPACRVHCASRRSLRADPNFDSLIAALYPDVDKYEEEELAFRDEDTERNRRLMQMPRAAERRPRICCSGTKPPASISSSSWHFKPSEGNDDATPEEQHKVFLSKLVTRAVYTCNHLQSELEKQHQELAKQHQELENLQRAVRNHKDLHEGATRALDSCVQELEQAAPRPDAGEPSSAASTRQLEERVDHVVAMLGDISTFAAPATISEQLDTLKTEVQQLHQLPDKDGNTSVQKYKMSIFRIEKFDDYTHQDPVPWWEGFTTELRIHFVPEHSYIGALFLNSKGGCEVWLSHLATIHNVQVADLHKKISWEDLTRQWKKRFIVDNAPTLAINCLFSMTQGKTPTREWLTKWQKIVATPDLDLPFLHVRQEFYNRSCAALILALVPAPLMDAGVEVVDLHGYVAKIDREFKTQRYDDIDTPLLYIRIQIEEATCSALIDCGATRNYISQDFMIQERIADTQRRQTEALVKRRSTIPASGGSFAGVRGGDGTFKSLRSRGRTRSKTLGVKRRSEASVDGEREGQLREIGRRTIRRPRIYEEAYLSDSLGGSGGFTEEEEEGDASFGEGGADEADPDFENNIGKRRGASAAAVVASAAAAAAAASAATAAAPAAMSGEGTGTGAAGMGGGASGGNAVMLRPPSTDVGTMLGNSANSGGGGASPGVNNPQPTTSGGNGHSGGLVTWARNGVRSHNRYGGNGNGGGNKLVKSFRAAGLLDALIARRDEEKAYEIHFCMCPLPSFVDTKEEPLAPLERMYLCCAPEIAVFHLRKM